MMIARMKMFAMACGIALSAILSIAQSQQMLDSSEFDYQYGGTDIFDGEEFVNDWSLAGDANAGELIDGVIVEINERGNLVLTQTPDNRNAWIQQDSELSPWEESGGLSWTVEVRAHLIGTEPDGDPVNNGFNIWAADGIQRVVATIQEDSFQSFGRPGEIFSEDTNDDGFHTFRITYDVDEDLYFFYRDGILVSEDGVFAQALTGNNRLIIGDCCTAANDLNPFLFEQLEIEYVRFDLDGAYEPLPPTVLPGDFNGDGLLDLNDINALAQQSAGGQNDPAYDLNSDNMVNAGDIAIWVQELKGTWLGDANLDGEFNSGDLVGVFTAGKYEVDEAANWEQGDWTGDQRFNSSDLVAAFSDGGYEAGPRAAVSAGISAVPEPAGALLGTLAMLALLKISRRVR